MQTIHIVEGPVGAGKTTFALALGSELHTPPLILDAWMVRLFRDDRPATPEEVWPWYAVRKERCIAQIWDVALGLMTAGSDAIVELGLLRKEDRATFCKRVKDAGFQPRIYVLDAPSDTRWHRVEQRNTAQGYTFAMVVSQDVFHLASEIWEPPTPAEQAAYPITFVTDGDATGPQPRR